MFANQKSVSAAASAFSTIAGSSPLDASEMVRSPFMPIVPMPAIIPVVPIVQSSVTISSVVTSITPVSPPSPSVNSPFASNTPSTMNVDEADSVSETWNGALTVDEAVLMNPASVDNPSTVRVEVACTPLPTKSSPEMYPFPSTESNADGEVEAMPTLPAPSITNRSLVPNAVELAILNFPPSEISRPTIQSKSATPVVEVAENARVASTSLVSMVIVDVAVIAPPKNDVPEMNALPSTERSADGDVEAMPTLPIMYALPSLLKLAMVVDAVSTSSRYFPSVVGATITSRPAPPVVPSTPSPPAPPAPAPPA